MLNTVVAILQYFAISQNRRTEGEKKGARGDEGDKTG